MGLVDIVDVSDEEETRERGSFDEGIKRMSDRETLLESVTRKVKGRF